MVSCAQFPQYFGCMNGQDILAILELNSDDTQAVEKAMEILTHYEQLSDSMGDNAQMMG